MLETNYDVIVIGGGPAGSTMSALLAKKGYRVVTFEKAKMPREHVGESLLPFCYDLFDELGVLEDLKGRFVRKPGVRFIDIDGKYQTTWCFGHVIKDESYLSFHVLRDEFDKLLLDNAARLGATVYEETRVRQVDLEEDGHSVSVVAVGPDGMDRTYTARFLVDASGRDTFLANRMRTKNPHKDLDRTALSGHWRGARYVGGIEEGLLQIVYLGGDKKGWIWVIPVGLDRLSVGVVLNSSYIRQEKEKFQQAGEEDWQRALYLQELQSAPFVRDLLAEAQTITPLMFNGNYSYTVDKKYGSNFALVGDASTFIDPIFASGVFISLKSASLVAKALDEHLSSENGNGLASLEKAYRNINGAYALVNKAILMFYNPDAINFAQVSSAVSLIHEKHENALAIGHYLLAGNFFEKHETYSAFLDMLQDQRLVRRYKGLVLDRSAKGEASCGTDRSHVFSELLADYEKERLERLEAQTGSAAP